MTGSTPGPWRFHQPWAGFSKITDQHGALIFGIAAGSDEERQPPEVCEANARLIAAAPDLLSACKAAIVALKGREHTGFLDAAIAKAEGRTNA